MDHSKSNPLLLVDDLLSDTPGPSESAATNKKEVSSVWNFFTKLGKDKDGIEKVVCKYCGHNYIVGKNPLLKTIMGFLKVVDRNYKSCPSFEEWDRGGKMCQFLEPFYEITNTMSGSSYPTSNLYLCKFGNFSLLLKRIC